MYYICILLCDSFIYHNYFYISKIPYAEFLDLTDNPIPVLPNHGFHGLYGLKSLILNRMEALERIEALGRSSHQRGGFILFRK
jgi:hypothetical protein